MDNTKRRVMKNTRTERCVSNTEATVGDTLPLRSPPVVRDHMLLLLYQEGGRRGNIALKFIILALIILVAND